MRWQSCKTLNGNSVLLSFKLHPAKPAYHLYCVLQNPLFSLSCKTLQTVSCNIHPSPRLAEPFELHLAKLAFLPVLQNLPFFPSCRIRPSPCLAEPFKPHLAKPAFLPLSQYLLIIRRPVASLLYLLGNGECQQRVHATTGSLHITYRFGA